MPGKSNVQHNVATLAVLSMICSNLCHSCPGPRYSIWNITCKTEKAIPQSEGNLIQLVLNLNWTWINVYSDVRSEKVDALTNMLIEPEKVQLRLITTTALSNNEKLADMGVLADSHSVSGRLHVVVCATACVVEILHLISQKSSASFGRKSKWVLITDSFIPNTVPITFENVGAITGKRESDHWKTLERSLETVGAITRKTSYQLLTLQRDGDDRIFTPVTLKDTCLSHQTSQDTSVLRQNDLFPNPQRNLNGRTLNVGIAEWPSLVSKTFNSQNKSDVTYDGFAIDLLQELQRTLNFRVNYVEPSEANVWEVLFGKLRTKTIDIICVPSIPSVHRLQTMDFSYPVLFDTVRIFYKQPTKKEIRWRVLLDLINWSAIGLILAGLLSTAVVLGSVEMVGQPQLASRRKYTKTLRHLIIHQLFKLFSTLLRQGQVESADPREPFSVRLVFAAWCMFCLILTATVTSYLVPALGVVRQTILFRTLKDLLGNDDYTWGMLGGKEIWYHQYFQTTNLSEHQDLYASMLKFNNTDPGVLSENISIHYDKMSEGNYAFVINERGFLSRCDLSYIDEILVSTTGSIPLIKNSPYTELFSEMIEHFFENGQMKIWNDKWFPPKRNCKTERASSDDLDLNYLHSVFFLLGVGLFSSIVFVIIEKATFCYKRTRSVNNSEDSSVITGARK